MFLVGLAGWFLSVFTEGTVRLAPVVGSDPGLQWKIRYFLQRSRLLTYLPAQHSVQ